VTERHRARQLLVLAVLALGSLVLAPPRPARAQSDTVPETSAVAPGDTAPDGGPLLVPGEPDAASSSAAEDQANSDNTGTVVALVISGLLVVALLLGLLTYWFWRNTRPTQPSKPARPMTPAAD
jgi:hypothetical protein